MYKDSGMTLNIILSAVFFVGVSVILVRRKGWKFYWIFLAIMSGILIIVGIGGIIINPFL